jgi:hypothetical protein
LAMSASAAVVWSRAVSIFGNSRPSSSWMNYLLRAARANGLQSQGTPNRP